MYTKLAVLRSDMYAEANRRQCPRRAGHRARPPNSGQVSVRARIGSTRLALIDGGPHPATATAATDRSPARSGSFVRLLNGLHRMEAFAGAKSLPIAKLSYFGWPAIRLPAPLCRRAKPSNEAVEMTCSHFPKCAKKRVAGQMRAALSRRAARTSCSCTMPLPVRHTTPIVIT